MGADKVFWADEVIAECFAKGGGVGVGVGKRRTQPV